MRTLTALMLLFSAVLCAKSQDVEKAILKANKYYAEEKYEKAIDYYTKAISMDSVRSDLYFKRGQACFFWGFDKQAIKDFNKAAAMGVEDPQLFYLRAQSRNLSGDTTGAIADFIKTTDLDSTFTDAYVRRATIAMEVGTVEFAIDLYTKAISVDPLQPAETFFARGYAFQQLGDYPQALNDYKTAIKINPDDSDFYLNSGDCSSALKDYENALAFYQKAVEVDPYSGRAYGAMGIMLAWQGQQQAACEAWSKARILGEEQFQGYYEKYCKAK